MAESLKKDKDKSKTCSRGKSRNGYKPKYRDPKKGHDDYVPTAENPVEWYYLNEQIARDVANLPYNVMTGRKLDIYGPGPDADGQSGYVGETPGVAGIMVLPLVCGVGFSAGSNSTINIAGRSVYTFVRHQNSGHANYEMSDLMMYILGMGEVYNAYAEACRIYRLAMTYKQTNRYMPKFILQALKVDVDDVMANLAQYRAGLNMLAAQISSMCVPNNFVNVARQAMLFTNVYMDSDTERGQYYIFRRGIARRFDPTGENGGYLKSYTIHPAGSPNATTADILREIKTLFSVIIEDEDMNIMSGDILKAYGREKLYTISGVEEWETVSPVFDETILSQIENSVSYLRPTNWTASPNLFNQDIIQVGNVIHYEPYVGFNSNDTDNINLFEHAILRNVIINSHKVDPDYKFNLEATRLTSPLGDKIDNGVMTKWPILCGTEFVLYMDLFRFRYDNAGLIGLANISVGSHLISDITDPNSAQRTAETLLEIGAYDWHPFIYVFQRNFDDGRSWKDWMPCGDFHTYCVASPDTINNMHQCALLGEFRTELLNGKS